MSVPIKAIIFDYGGTLDSRGDHWSVVIKRAYEADGLILPRDAFRSAYIHAERALDGTGIISKDDTFLDVMRKKITLQLTYLTTHHPELIAQKVPLATSVVATATPTSPAPGSTFLPPVTKLTDAIARRCYDSARECVSESTKVIKELAKRYPIGIVSNFYGNIRAVLADFGLLPHITAVIDSTEIGIRKPDPAIFAAGIQAITDAAGIPLTPAQVLVVGDSIDKDILPASSLGCPTALLQGTPWDDVRSAASIPATTHHLNALSDLLYLLD